ncbi:MAG: hypothetical protein WC464_08160 [Bdellovibrionales bacterium]
MMTKKHFGLTVLALSLAFSLPAYAQTAASVSPPPPSTAPEPPLAGKVSPRDNGFRDDAEWIRKEQEELDIGRDKLIDRCMFAPKEQASSCVKEKEDLRARSDKLHEARTAMHEKMETLRKQHEEMRKKRVEERKARRAKRPQRKMAPSSSVKTAPSVVTTPVTQAPVTQAPVTAAPVTSAPAEQAPAMQ